MHPGIPLAYAARHIYSANEDPYRARGAGTASRRRRRRRRTAAFLFPRRPRPAFLQRRAAPGR
jgi:hypothetical protein